MRRIRDIKEELVLFICIRILPYLIRFLDISLFFILPVLELTGRDLNPFDARWVIGWRILD